MSTRHDLQQLYDSHYQLRNLAVSAESFRSAILRRLDGIDALSEGYLDPTKQRDLSIKYHWGHNHDFGDGFVVPGRMTERHINLVAEYVDAYGLPRDLRGKRVLDIGVWTGGTSLLLAAMGAEVIAIEEVVKYAETVNFLAASFGVSNQVRCLAGSLYDLLPRFADEFDFVHYPGVIYHVTDPVLSLRYVFAAMKNGARLFLETYGWPSDESLCHYEGPSVVLSGDRSQLNRGGWNYFAPSPKCLEAWCRDVGFQETHIGRCVERRITGSATRTEFVDLCRAGLSRANCR